MKELGQVFRKIREARNISLTQSGDGGSLTSSMLSRFENVQNDLSVSKFYLALQEINMELDEFTDLVSGIQQSYLSELLDEIQESLDTPDKLQTLYDREVDLAESGSDKDKHQIAALCIKGYMRGIDETVEMTSEDSHFLHDYLFSRDIWGRYEFQLFSICSTLLSPDLFIKYVREVLHRADFFEALKHNRSLVQTMLLNAYLLCIGIEDFTNTAYFEKQIEANFYTENEMYYRTVYLYAQGLLAYQKGEKEQGLDKMNHAVQVFEILGGHSYADYYRDKSDQVVNH